jgi:hypothetical protein
VRPNKLQQPDYEPIDEAATIGDELMTAAHAPAKISRFILRPPWLRLDPTFPHASVHNRNAATTYAEVWM